MMLEEDDQDLKMQSSLGIGYLFFNTFFISEAIFKIYVIGFRNYMLNNWNRFDFFIVSTSIIDIVMNLLEGNETIQQFIKIIKLLRIARLFKIAKNVKGI
jgi:hypothetical protein